MYWSATISRVSITTSKTIRKRRTIIRPILSLRRKPLSETSRRISMTDCQARRRGSNRRKKNIFLKIYITMTSKMETVRKKERTIDSFHILILKIMHRISKRKSIEFQLLSQTKEGIIRLIYMDRGKELCSNLTIETIVKRCFTRRIKNC